jgi:hypothetical protein
LRVETVGIVVNDLSERLQAKFDAIDDFAHRHVAAQKGDTEL